MIFDGKSLSVNSEALLFSIFSLSRSLTQMPTTVPVLLVGMPYFLQCVDLQCVKLPLRISIGIP
eukprot:6721493-Karenia_brevis.AAC.1